MALVACPSCAGLIDDARGVEVVLPAGGRAGDGKFVMTAPGGDEGSEEVERAYPCEAAAWLTTRARPVPPWVGQRRRGHHHAAGPEPPADVPLTVALRCHVVARPSGFSAIPLVMAACEHGLRRHPDPAVQDDYALNRKGVTWIRGRYLDSKGRCPVDRGSPRPDDLTCGYADPPGATVGAEAAT